MANSEFDVFCRAAFDLLTQARVRFLVIGGLAVAVIGEPRVTGDVDVVAFTSTAGAERLIDRAKAAGFDVDPAAERERLRTTGTLRFRRGRYQLDVIRASLPFEDAALARGMRRRLFGRMVRLPTAPSTAQRPRAMAGPCPTRRGSSTRG